MKFQVEETKDKMRVRKTLKECGKVDMKMLGFVKYDAQNRDRWMSMTTGNRKTLPKYSIEGVVFYGLRSRDIKR